MDSKPKRPIEEIIAETKQLMESILNDIHEQDDAPIGGFSYPIIVSKCSAKTKKIGDAIKKIPVEKRNGLDVLFKEMKDQLERFSWRSTASLVLMELVRYPEIMEQPGDCVPTKFHNFMARQAELTFKKTSKTRNKTEIKRKRKGNGVI